MGRRRHRPSRAPRRRKHSHRLTLFEALGFAPGRHLGALSRVRWPGRFGRAPIPGFRCPVYLSGDHNEQGVESLLEILTRFQLELNWQHLHLIVGIGKDKHAEAMLERLARLPRARISLTETPFKPLALEDYPPAIAARAIHRNRDPMHVLESVRGRAREGRLWFWSPGRSTWSC